MRHKLWTILPFLGSGLVIALSFALPEAVSAIQDQQLGAQVGSIEIAVPSMDMTFWERLQFFSAPYITVELEPEGGETADQAYQTASEALSLFTGNELECSAYSASRSLAVSKESAQTALLWEYTLISPHRDSAFVRLDAESGKLISCRISFPLRVYLADSDTYQSDSTSVRALAQSWAETCVDYYGFQAVEIQTPEESGLAENLYRFTCSTKDGQRVEAVFLATETEIVFQLGAP